MITKAMAVRAGHGDVFYHVTAKNADGTPARARVSGRCRTWMTQPDRFLLPMKHGLKDSFYITPSNAKEWCLTPHAILIEAPDPEPARPRFVSCGGCGLYHPADWYGDCRVDSQRFTRDELDGTYGVLWIEVSS